MKKSKKKKAGTESGKESSLRDWFGRKGAKGKKKGWVKNLDELDKHLEKVIGILDHSLLNKYL